MSEAIRFLHSLAQALSTLVLYSPGHPATRRSIDGAWQALGALLRVDEHPTFFFLGTAPVYSGRALHELRDWPYAKRLTEVGVQRLEFDTIVTEEGLAEFFNQLMIRLNSGPMSAEEGLALIPGIMYGSVAVETAVEEDVGEAEEYADTYVELNAELSDEIDAMGYVLDEGVRGVVARAEVEAVSRILGGFLEHHDAPQISWSNDFSRYPCMHPINTALLAMAGARAAGVDPAGRQRIGVVSLLHDIGMTRLRAGLGSQSWLSPDDRTLIESHPREGARLLLDHGGRGMELAAIVCYEHQLRPDGGGYPPRRFRPVPHWASRLVGTAAAFVALRAPRPYRPAWSLERAMGALEVGEGTVFDAEAAKLLLGVLRQS